ncbi:MAG: hypothetical protein VYA34_06215 [Myxococcota bacterium]|nr:hypothetical protein [Myxococcota bacterium]
MNKFGTILVVVGFLAGCGGSDGGSDGGGDGENNPREIPSQCGNDCNGAIKLDGGVPVFDCSQYRSSVIGETFVSGVVSCTEQCTLDTSDCRVGMPDSGGDGVDTTPSGPVPEGLSCSALRVCDEGLECKFQTCLKACSGEEETTCATGKICQNINGTGSLEGSYYCMDASESEHKACINNGKACAGSEGGIGCYPMGGGSFACKKLCVDDENCGTGLCESGARGNVFGPSTGSSYQYLTCETSEDCIEELKDRGEAVGNSISAEQEAYFQEYLRCAQLTITTENGEKYCFLPETLCSGEANLPLCASFDRASFFSCFVSLGVGIDKCSSDSVAVTNGETCAPIRDSDTTDEVLVADAYCFDWRSVDPEYTYSNCVAFCDDGILDDETSDSYGCYKTLDCGAGQTCNVWPYTEATQRGSDNKSVECTVNPSLCDEGYDCVLLEGSGGNTGYCFKTCFDNSDCDEGGGDQCLYDEGSMTRAADATASAPKYCFSMLATCGVAPASTSEFNTNCGLGAGDNQTDNQTGD